MDPTANDNEQKSWFAAANIPQTGRTFEARRAARSTADPPRLAGRPLSHNSRQRLQSSMILPPDFRISFNFFPAADLRMAC